MIFRFIPKWQPFLNCEDLCGLAVKFRGCHVASAILLERRMPRGKQHDLIRPFGLFICLDIYEPNPMQSENYSGGRNEEKDRYLPCSRDQKLQGEQSERSPFCNTLRTTARSANGSIYGIYHFQALHKKDWFLLWARLKTHGITIWKTSACLKHQSVYKKFSGLSIKLTLDCTD